MDSWEITLAKREAKGARGALFVGVSLGLSLGLLVGGMALGGMKAGVSRERADGVCGVRAGVGLIGKKGTGAAWELSGEKGDEDAVRLEALSKLGLLEVRSWGVLGYDRKSFGVYSKNVMWSGCGLRDYLLNRDLNVTAWDTDGKTPIEGILPVDPFSGKQISFSTNKLTVSVDHLVSLGDAWRSGASSWTPRQRNMFLNDVENTIIVDNNLNIAKGDSTADKWLPPNKKYRKVYVIKQILIKSKYGLSVTTREKEAMRRVLV